ncbi:MAG: RNA polymerase sigma factor [Gemmatimonadetes bacterium]|nr:RNA polymerase sigma factor [Gemmatimonadota bacterium]
MAAVEEAAAARAPSDAALVARVVAGERESDAALVRRYQTPLYRFARGMGLDGDAAQDAVQDALVTAYTRLRECREPDRFRVWLFRILRNRCLDGRKAERRRTARGEAWGLASGDAHAPAVELRLTLAEALGALSAAMREAFLLKHLEGYGYEEIAEITGAGVSAAKMRVHRAREALRAALLEPEPST